MEANDAADPTSDCEVKGLMVSRMMGRVGRRQDRKSGQVPGYLLVLDSVVGLKSTFAVVSALSLPLEGKEETHLELVQFRSIQ